MMVIRAFHFKLLVRFYALDLARYVFEASLTKQIFSSRKEVLHALILE